MDKRAFIEYSEVNNKNYTFLCVDNTSQSNNPEDFLLRLKASEEEAKRISEAESESDAQSVEEEECA